MGKVLFKFFILNKRNFIILLVSFLIGFILGIFIINYSSNYQKEQITLEVNNIIDNIKNSENIDKQELFLVSIKRNVLWIIIVWFLGCTIIGGILIYLIIIYKGFLLGYTISSLIAVLGIKSGFLITAVSLILHNLVYIVALFLIAENRN